MKTLCKTVSQILYVNLLLGSSVVHAQNLFLRGLLTADAQECRALYSPQTPGFNSNLVAYWQLNGTVGVIGNGATLNSAIAGGPSATATISSNSLAYTASGIIGQGITANGTDADSISAGTPAALNDLPAATWMAWIKVVPGTSMRIFYKSDNNGSAGYFFLLDSDGKFKFAKVHNGQNLQNFTSVIASSYLSNTWHQVVVTWDGTSVGTGVKIYMDGKELAYDPADPRFDTTSGNSSYIQNGTSGYGLDASVPFLLLGKPSNSSTNPNSGAFSGTMDEMAIWNRVLTATEVARLYRHQKCN